LEKSHAQSVLTLSGGEQQRVALARSLAPSPSLLMLDEPLGALDTVLRNELAEEVPRILREARQTAIYVTHDPEEALSVSDRVALLRGGRVEQIGTPGELLTLPASAFAAQFLSLGVLVPAALDGQRLKTDIGSIPWYPRAIRGSGEGFILVRPTAVRFPANDGLRGVKAKFIRCQPRHDGVSWRIALKGESGAEYVLNVMPWNGNGTINPPPPGSEMTVGIGPEGLAFFPT
jgi:ABC-type Fe3+/spermidine/putrescine transport system ATPase subunit